VINIRTTKRNGKVVALMDVLDEDELMMITQKGMIVRTPVKGVRTIGRATQGVKLINLNGDDKLVAVARIGERDEDEEEAEDAGPAPAEGAEAEAEADEADKAEEAKEPEPKPKAGRTKKKKKRKK